MERMETNISWGAGSGVKLEISYMPNEATVGEINFEIGDGSLLHFRLPLHKAEELLDLLAGKIALAAAVLSLGKAKRAGVHLSCGLEDE